MNIPLLLLLLLLLVVFFIGVFLLYKNESSHVNTSLDSTISTTIQQSASEVALEDKPLSMVHTESSIDDSSSHVKSPRNNSISSQSGWESKFTPAASAKKVGLVLFDVDGTLTTGLDNYQVVQEFLDRNWAIGIVTAGSIYTIENIHRYHWMPLNLSQYLADTGYNTFNNVAAEPPILCGKPNPRSYKKADEALPRSTDLYGFRKGHALVKTGEALGLAPAHVLICDDLLPFVDGVRKYNSEIQVIYNSSGLNLQQVRSFLRMQEQNTR